MRIFIFSFFFYLELKRQIRPKGIVGGFQCTVLQRNLKEWYGIFAMLCLGLLKESNDSRFDSESNVRTGISQEVSNELDGGF